MEGYGNFGSEERLPEEVIFKVYVKDKWVLNEGLEGYGLAKCDTGKLQGNPTFFSIVGNEWC